MSIESILLFLGISAIVFLIDTALLYLATNTLKYREKGYTKAVIATGTQWMASMALIIVAVVTANYLNLYSIESQATISFLTLTLSLFAFIYIIKHFYNEDWKKTALAFLLVVGGQVLLGILVSFALMAPMIFWQMGALQ